IIGHCVPIDLPGVERYETKSPSRSPSFQGSMLILLLQYEITYAPPTNLSTIPNGRWRKKLLSHHRPNTICTYYNIASFLCFIFKSQGKSLFYINIHKPLGEVDMLKSQFIG